MVTENILCKVSVRRICGPSLDGLSVRAHGIQTGDDERVWGGNGKTPNSLAVFIRAVYHEERGHGPLCPEMNKKIIFPVCFITENHFSQIRADKSFTEKWGCVCVWVGVCTSGFLCLSTRVQAFWCVGVLQQPCLCMCLLVWLSTDSVMKGMSISVSWWGGVVARGSMIKMLNQTPCLKRHSRIMQL